MSVRHGTTSGYTYHGCRCAPCTRAKRLYQREQRAGVRRPLLDATATREHLLMLRAEGWSWAALGRATGYHHAVIAAIAKGDTKNVRQATAEDLQTIQTTKEMAA